ncbi:MAG: FMN-binding negative transcriptional regulator [Bacteroidota bacterium]
MYSLPNHKETDEKVIKAFIEDHPFAFLSGCDKDNRPVATQVPVFYEEREGQKFLSGHIMKNTDHHKAFEHNDNVLVVFTGNHTYVSGTWYSDPYTASTWNYMSVHAKGKIRFLDGDALENMLRKTSLHFEGYNKESPTIYDNLPKSFLDKVMKAIVAFEIEVTEMDNVFKLSQNRDEKSYHNIIEHLRGQGEDGKAIAEEMERRTKEVFPDK